MTGRIFKWFEMKGDKKDINYINFFILHFWSIKNKSKYFKTKSVIFILKIVILYVYPCIHPLNDQDVQPIMKSNLVRFQFTSKRKKMSTILTNICSAFYPHLLVPPVGVVVQDQKNFNDATSQIINLNAK